jgi:hypothetical protein
MIKVDSFKDLYDESWCFYWFSSETRNRGCFLGLLAWASPMNLAASLQCSWRSAQKMYNSLKRAVASSSEPVSLGFA